MPALSNQDRPTSSTPDGVECSTSFLRAGDRASSVSEASSGGMHQTPFTSPSYVRKSDLEQVKTDLLVSVKELLSDLVGQHLRPSASAAQPRAGGGRHSARLTRDALERLARVGVTGCDSDCPTSACPTTTTSASCSTAASLPPTTCRPQHPRPPLIERRRCTGNSGAFSSGGGGGGDSGGGHSSGGGGWTASLTPNTSHTSSRRTSSGATDVTWTANSSVSRQSQPAFDVSVSQHDRTAAAAAAAPATAPSPLWRDSRHDAESGVANDGVRHMAAIGAEVKAAAGLSATLTPPPLDDNVLLKLLSQDGSSGTDTSEASGSLLLPSTPTPFQRLLSGGGSSGNGGHGSVGSSEALSSPTTPTPFRRLRVSSEVTIAPPPPPQEGGGRRRDTWDGVEAAPASTQVDDNSGASVPQVAEQYSDAGGLSGGAHSGRPVVASLGSLQRFADRSILHDVPADDGAACTGGTWQYVHGDLGTPPISSSNASVTSHLLQDTGGSDYDCNNSSPRSSPLGSPRLVGRHTKRHAAAPLRRHHLHHDRLCGGSSSDGSCYSGGSGVRTASSLVPRELLDATAGEALRLTGLVSRLQRELCEAQAELAGRDAVVQLLHGRLDELAAVASAAMTVGSPRSLGRCSQSLSKAHIPCW